MNEPTSQESRPKRKLPRWLWIVLFALAVATPAVMHLRRVGAVDKEALGALIALGAEPINRELRDEELDLPIQTHDGGHTSLRQALAGGDVVILHFWASWCGPCLEELPEIGQLANALEKRRMKLVSVSHDDEWADADAALAKTIGKAQPAAGTWLREFEGQSGEEKKMLRVQLGTLLLPETYVLADDRVLVRFIAGQPWMNPKLLGALERLAPLR